MLPLLMTHEIRCMRLFMLLLQLNSNKIVHVACRDDLAEHFALHSLADNNA